MTCVNLFAAIEERIIESPPINVAFPEVEAILPREIKTIHINVPEKINQAIEELVKRMMLEMGAEEENLEEMEGTYKVTLNKKGILSIRFENFSFIQMQAHPWNIVRGLTFDLRNGKVATLGDLFRRNSMYRKIIVQEINRQIEERQIPLITDTIKIQDDQTYYLTDKALVIVFPRATIAPAVAGVPEFPIPYSLLANVINKEGLLAPLVNKC
ncbi:MAG: RsiV family protein [Bacillota bacterium]|nr:RsiV family protein [Bacillota bacterium]